MITHRPRHCGTRQLIHTAFNLCIFTTLLRDIKKIPKSRITQMVTDALSSLLLLTAPLLLAQQDQPVALKDTPIQQEVITLKAEDGGTS